MATPVLAVTAVGADRPGIIARVASVLTEHGGNLTDSTMTILGGQFAIMLLVATEAAPLALEDALAAATRDLGLVVTVRPVGEGTVGPPPTHVLSVYGADRTGIVAAVTAGLAARSVNVTDLETRVLEGERPVYAMLLELALPPGVDPDRLVDELRADAALDDLEATLRPLDTVTF